MLCSIRSIHAKRNTFGGAGYCRITFIYCCVRKTTSSWSIPIESEIMPFLLDSSSYQTLSVYSTYIAASKFALSECLFDIRRVFYHGVRFFPLYFPFFVDSCALLRNMKKRCKRHTRKPDISTFTYSFPALAKFVLVFGFSCLLFFPLVRLLVSMLAFLPFKQSKGERRSCHLMNWWIDAIFNQFYVN